MMIPFIGPSFTLQVPTDWYIIASPAFQAMLLSPALPNGQRANFTIILEPLEDTLDLETYVRGLMDNQKKRFADLQILEAGEVRAPEAGLFYRCQYTSPELQAPVMQYHALFQADGMRYNLIGSRPVELSPEHEQLLDSIFEDIAHSFELRNATLGAV